MNLSHNNQINWPRRKFINTVALAGAAITFKPVASWGASDQDPRVSGIVASTIGIDAHNYITAIGDRKMDLASEMTISGFSAISMTCAPDYDEPHEVYNGFHRWMTTMDKQLKDNGMKRSLNLSDIHEAHKNRIPTVIQAMKGGRFLEKHLERLEEAHKRGLRHFSLLHEEDSDIPFGDIFTNIPGRGGLTSFGMDVMKECNRLGILVDLARCSSETVSAALKFSKHPVIVSNTGLDTRLGRKMSDAQKLKPRLISKEHAKIIADSAGVIGVWTKLTDYPLEYARNIQALADVVGIDHVCIGTDTSLAPAHFNSHDKFQFMLGENTNYAWLHQTSGFYYVVVEALLTIGFTPEEIGKIGGGNYCRVFDEATKNHA